MLATYSTEKSKLTKAWISTPTAVLMSTNIALLTLGMVVAGPLTDAFGARWIWGAAAVVAAVAGIVGFILARGVRQQPQEAVEPEPESEAWAVTAHGAGSGQP